MTAPMPERTREQAELLALVYQKRVTVSGHTGQWRVYFKTSDRVQHDVTEEAKAIVASMSYAKGNGG